MSRTITWDDLSQAAARLEVEPCAMRAVYSVEAAGNGFLPSGRPKILFEGHIFWKELKKRGADPAALCGAHPDLIYPKWVKTHYKGGEKEYDRLDRAESLNREAAWCSASWGAFQIMGFNFAACGYGSVDDFVQAQRESAAAQLAAFCGFISQARLVRHLKSLDWAAFARGYNGPGYAENKYDQKLKAAYENCKREHS